MRALNCKSYCQAGFASVSQLAKTGSNSIQNSWCNKGDYKEPKTKGKVGGIKSQYETLTGNITDIFDCNICEHDSNTSAFNSILVAHVQRLVKAFTPIKRFYISY